MTGPRLKALAAQMAEIKKNIEQLDRADVAAMTTEAQATWTADYDKLLDRAELLKPEIAELEKREQSVADVAEITRRLSTDSGSTIDRATTTQAQQAPELTAAEYFAEVFRTFGREHGDGDVDRFMDRCGRYIDRANQATTDNVGVLPTPIVGQLIKFVDANRRVFSSFTSRPMPQAGKTFTRPRVTQRTLVGEQLVEFDPLASQKMLIVGDPVSKRTFGGQLSISQQDIDWTDPAMLSIVIDDFADEYGIQTEQAARNFIGDLPATFTPYVVTNVGTLVTSYVDASVLVYNQCKRYADTVWIELADWAVLSKTLTANSDRTALSLIREAFEGAGLPQLNFVVVPGSPGIEIPAAEDLNPAGDRIMGVSSLVESYEQQKGLLRLENPGTLSQTIATYGYIAFYGRPEGFIYLGADATP